MTPAEWEAEKARIDEERTRLYERLLPYVGMLTASNVSIDHYPYPSKPERTVTLKMNGYEYTLAGGMLRYRSDPENGWTTLYSESDLRLLASLLPENQET